MALHPEHGVPIRRFEPGRVIEIITENLASMGLTYKIRWTGFGRTYVIGRKTYRMNELVAFVDKWRAKQGLALLSPVKLKKKKKA